MERTKISNIIISTKKQHKVDNPTSMNDLRPTSLCNVIYKIVAKVLANRIKFVLPCIS